MRIVLGVEYDGSAFHGWQRQSHDPCTIQACLEHALSLVANHSISVVCAGRTDKGVHALHQVVHFDTVAERTSSSWLKGGNRYLPDTVAIRWVKPVISCFHARYKAQVRSYRYLIYNKPTRPGLYKSFVTWHYKPLNVELMRQAALKLLGEQDFTSLRARDCQSKSSHRHIYQISITENAPFVILEISANAFLKHMVRNIVGVLFKVGEGEKSPQWVEEVLAAKNRCSAAVTAPAQGLSLIDVQYPKEYDLPVLVKKEVPLCIGFYSGFQKG